MDQGDFDPASIEVFVGMDMAKGDHYAQAITTSGEGLFDRPIANDETAITQLIVEASAHGRAALVVDQPASGAQLLLALARDAGVPVAYVTGLQMRRAADLYAGSAKTDPRDAWVLADFARRNADRLCWLSVTDELLTQLRGPQRPRRGPGHRRQPHREPLPGCPGRHLPSARTCSG